MGDWKRGESKQMTPWEGKGQVPKKKASVWDRPGLQSGGYPHTPDTSGSGSTQNRRFGAGTPAGSREAVAAGVAHLYF